MHPKHPFLDFLWLRLNILFPLSPSPGFFDRGGIFFPFPLRNRPGAGYVKYAYLAVGRPAWRLGKKKERGRDGREIKKGKSPGPDLAPTRGLTSGIRPSVSRERCQKGSWSVRRPRFGRLPVSLRSVPRSFVGRGEYGSTRFAIDCGDRRGATYVRAQPRGDAAPFGQLRQRISTHVDLIWGFFLRRRSRLITQGNARSENTFMQTSAPQYAYLSCAGPEPCEIRVATRVYDAT